MGSRGLAGAGLGSGEGAGDGLLGAGDGLGVAGEGLGLGLLLTDPHPGAHVTAAGQLHTPAAASNSRPVGQDVTEARASLEHLRKVLQVESKGLEKSPVPLREQ